MTRRTGDNEVDAAEARAAAGNGEKRKADETGCEIIESDENAEDAEGDGLISSGFKVAGLIKSKCGYDEV